MKFRENEKADTKKYSPEDLLGFTTDTLRFASLFNLEVYAANYALLGQTLKIKHTFGQLLDKGSFNIYLVLISDYNAIAGVAATYPNFIFERKLNGVYQYAAYPAATRMKERKYETAKENLYIFFKDYPDIIEKIKSYKRENTFLEVIELMKNYN